RCHVALVGDVDFKPHRVAEPVALAGGEPLDQRQVVDDVEVDDGDVFVVEPVVFTLPSLAELGVVDPARLDITRYRVTVPDLIVEQRIRVGTVGGDLGNVDVGPQRDVGDARGHGQGGRGTRFQAREVGPDHLAAAGSDDATGACHLGGHPGGDLVSDAEQTG